MSAVVAWLAVAVIDLYRAVLSPWLGPRCRFYPSCSEYARESIRLAGPWRGTGRALVRLAKCHPLHPGGVDLPRGA